MGKKTLLIGLYIAFSVPTVFLAMWIEFQNCPQGLPQIEVPLVFIPAIFLGFLCGKLRMKKVFLRGLAINFLSSLVGVAVVSLAQVACPRHDVPFWNHFKPASTALGMLLFASVLAAYVAWLFFLLGGGERPKK